MTVAVVGDGPAVAAVRSALGDVDTAVLEPGVGDVGEADVAVVVGVAGDSGFERANRAAADAEIPWFAVEVGGLGGRAFEDVAASVSGFGPGAGCYECLQTRVAAATDPTDAEPSAARADVRLAGAVAGREAVRALAGDPRLGTVVHADGRRRRFLPVPGCGTCGTARDYDLAVAHREVGLDATAASAETAVDDRVGPVTTVGERESFPAPYYLARLADTGGFADVQVPRHAAGVDPDWNAAYVKAVGEALERYSAGVYRAREFVHAAEEDLDSAVPPQAFVRPQGSPIPAPSEKLAWVPARHLSNGTPTHLPAEFVHYPPPEERFRPAITTGLGLGTSTVDALLSGLREVVERDATMLAWYSTFEPLGLSVDDDTFETLARRAASEDLTVTPLLVTQDVDVPVVTVAVHREAWPRFAVGSAAGLDAADAAVDALAEALQNWMELRALGREGAADATGEIGHYADFPDPVREFVTRETSVAAADVGPADPPTGEAALDALVERVTDAGIEPYGARVTTRDLETLGFEAVRVLVPRAQPLFVDEPFFGERAREVPASMGFEPALDRPYHPYP